MVGCKKYRRYLKMKKAANAAFFVRYLRLQLFLLNSKVTAIEVQLFPLNAYDVSNNPPR